MNNSPKKTVWSLQDNIRTEDQRNAFKPTGKKPRSKTPQYLVISVLVLFLVSFLLLQMYQETLETCITEDFCINSKDNLLLYTLYVFTNICIVILSIVGAYAIGKKLSQYIKI